MNYSFVDTERVGFIFEREVDIMCLKIKRSLEKDKGEKKLMKYQETREKVLEVAVKCLNKG